MTARFAIVGAGGLGGPIAYALAAAGARAITICDDDVVDLSNLSRQIQFTTADVGRPKAEALAGELVRRGTPRQRLRVVAERFGPTSAAAVLDGVDVAIDASDNFATKFAVNDAACAARIPFVIAAAIRYQGQVLAAAPGRSGCYRCLFETPPDDDDTHSCATAGVLGPVVGVIGGAAATAALGLAAGGSGGELLAYDDLRAVRSPRRVRYNRRPGCPACPSKEVP